MTLDAYLRKNGAPSLTDLAVRLKVSKGRLSQLRNSREWPPELALRLEEQTSGAISASDVCPLIANARDAA